MDIIVLIPVLFLSIILHEVAHGYVAYRMGDDTAYVSGRLTLNPVSHVDWYLGCAGGVLAVWVAAFRVGQTGACQSYALAVSA